MPPESAIVQRTLEMLVLKSLSLAPMHGWGIGQRIDQLSKGAFQVKQGSLYPALLRMKRADWDEVLATNLTASFTLCQAALKPMIRARSGRIVAVSSVVGQTGNAGQANYAASKAGLIGFCKSLAREVASRQVSVNVVAPGLIETDMTTAISGAAKTDWSAQIPLGRMGSPAEIAAAVSFLASDEASYITGQVLAVNGGMYM